MNIYTVSVNNNKKDIYRAFKSFHGVDPDGNKIDFSNYYLQINEKPTYVIMGEFHFSRYPNSEWEEEIIKIKMSGVNTIATYVFWNMHEREEGVFDYSGDLDVKRFISLCNKHGIYVVLRIGPFCHGEVRNGGIPDWLFGRPFKLRSNDKRYLDYVRELYQSIAREITGLYFNEGGPVIGIQLENEFMHCGAPWETVTKQTNSYVEPGHGSEEHMLKLKEIALENSMEPVFFSCTGWGSPVPKGEMLPMYGGYAFTPWSPDPSFIQEPTEHYVFRDYHQDSDLPNACCEMGGGIQITYHHRPVVPPESIEAMTVVRMAGGSNLLGYYMFHGGTNPEIDNIFYNEYTVPKKSYDFQAPLGEFGQIRDSYRRLKYLFYFLNKFGDLLAPMKTVLPAGASEIQADDVDSLRWAVRTDNKCGFVFLNNYQDHVDTKDIEDIKLKLEINSEAVNIPTDSSLELRSGESVIFPFNFNMKGALLKSSTAQLITFVEVEDRTVYFFFEREGIKAEYCFDKKNLRNDRHFFHPEIGSDKEPIELETDEGIIAIVTLTHEEAMNLWVCNAWGRERVIITPSDIQCSEGGVKFKSDNNKIDFKVFPDPKLNIQNQSDSGSFRKYKIQVSEKEVNVQIRYPESSKAEIAFEKNLFDGVEDIIMSVDYAGDIGNAFSRGKLLSDDFCYGKKWEIGLKRHADDILENGMYLYILPKKEGTEKMKTVEFAFNPDFAGDLVAEINDIKLIPIYAITISNS